jgi:hypothetical protein
MGFWAYLEYHFWDTLNLNTNNMDKIKLLFNGNWTAKKVTVIPKTARLLFHDYIDENGLFGDNVAIYSTGKRIYYKVSKIKY